MNLIASPPHIEIFVNNQGGGSHGAFVAGAEAALLQSQSPRFHINGFGGTSSGALTTVAGAEGLIRGADDRDGGNQRAAGRIMDLWLQQLPDSYEGTLTSLCNQMMDAGQEACEATPMVRPYARFMRHMISLAREMATANVLPMFNPLFSLLEDMEKRGHGFDFDALKNSALPVFVNATHVRIGDDPYQALPYDERVFKNAEINKKTLAASGTIYEIMTPIIYNGERLYDGAHTANPNLDRPVALCEQLGADMVLLRTRPSRAYASLDGKTPRRDKDRRAFFNNKLDDQLAAVQASHPHVRIHVIEPSSLEEKTSIIPSEIRFEREDMAMRFEAGYRAAQAAIVEMTQPTWLSRKAERSVPMREMRAQPVAQAQTATA